MDANLQAALVTYEELADLEVEFDDVETEIIRHQVQLTRPLYEKRHKVVSKIPNFWPLVLEQAPPDVDEYIQPSDSALLLSSLTSLSVSHFEAESGGDPRSVSIKWEFSDNDHFEDSVLEKKFWYRHAEDGWAGLVSEPVDIRWKKDKDLTGGLLGMVKRVWDEEQALEKAGNGAAKTKAKDAELTPQQKALKKKMEETGLGGLSFFAWFGYRGRRVSEEENQRAVAKKQEKRKLKLEGKKVEPSADDAEEDEEDDDDDLEGLEIFPEGDTLAVTIAEDVWPSAIKYFTQAQEQDALSDFEFESGMEELEEQSEDEEEPPSKKRKA